MNLTHEQEDLVARYMLARIKQMDETLEDTGRLATSALGVAPESENVIALAETKMRTSKLGFADAITQVFEENPALHTEWRNS